VEPRDEDIVLSVLAGNREAFSTLVRRHQDAVYSVCCHFLGHSEEAKDAAQEALVRAYGSLARLNDRRAFGSWLRGIAAHVALDLARQRQRLLARPEIDASEVGASPDPSLDPQRSIAARETLREVRAAIDALPEPYRLVAVFRFGLEMKYSEIAQALGITEGAVEVRLVRARRMLREKLSPVLAGAPEGAI
jgi:RNA polymerase sigma-70 factor (ECF subfamily)